jgi:hypothetical protein
MSHSHRATKPDRMTSRALVRLDKNQPRIGKAANTCEYFFAWIGETFG